MASERFDFPGAGGHRLAALLDRPAGEPAAYALFAHCFTCGKDVRAAKHIAERLTACGIAVLRFDFTGLGMSEGEFANTTFSSNVADLIAAANHLRATHRAPAILIGHSLGGAAVLAAARRGAGGARRGDDRGSVRPKPCHAPVQGACRRDPRRGRSRGEARRPAVPHPARIPGRRRRAAARPAHRDLAQGVADLPFADRPDRRHRERQRTSSRPRSIPRASCRSTRPTTC